jgi:hypothetical protein
MQMLSLKHLHFFMKKNRRFGIVRHLSKVRDFSARQITKSTARLTPAVDF